MIYQLRSPVRCQLCLLSAGGEDGERTPCTDPAHRLGVEGRTLLETVIEQAPGGLVIAEAPSGRLILGNRQVEEILRRPFLPSASVEEYGDWKGFHPDGRPYLPEEWPLARSLKSGEVVRDEEVGFLRGDGTRAVISLNSAPIRDPDGRIIAAVVTFHDITERKQAEESALRRGRELAAIRAVTAAVSGSLHLSEVLAALRDSLAGQLGVPAGCLFLYEPGDDRFSPRLHWGISPQQWIEFKRLLAAGVGRERVGLGKDEVLALGFCEVEPFLCSGPGGARSEWRGGTCVLLMAKGEVQGVAVLLSRDPDFFDEHQEAFFKTVGQEVGFAVQNARLYEQVRAARRGLQDLSHRLVRVQEEERRHLARELHDQVGQVLTGLKLLLETGGRLPAEKVGRNLALAQDAVNDLMEQVRDISLELRPAMLDDFGLLPALLWQFERYTAQTGIRVTFDHAGLDRRFDAELETSAYRVVQEALTNIARHAGVTEAVVRVWAGRDTLFVLVEDRGKGFDPGAGNGGVTGGISGLHERVALLGGRLEISSAPGDGTRLFAELPLPPAVGEMHGNE